MDNPMSVDDNYTRNLAKEYAEHTALRVEQKIRVCLKPKPRFIPEKAWLKIASRFIYIEKTEPSFSITPPSGDQKRDKARTEAQLKQLLLSKAVLTANNKVPVVPVSEIEKLFNGEDSNGLEKCVFCGEPTRQINERPICSKCWEEDV